MTKIVLNRCLKCQNRYSNYQKGFQSLLRFVRYTDDQNGPQFLILLLGLIFSFLKGLSIAHLSTSTATHMTKIVINRCPKY